jgi:hypothetical protein
VSSTSNRKLTRFFVPLAIQAASQALCYPLVAMVASRGPGGPLNLAGMAQANTVMFFLGMFAISYVTTGMVYAKTIEGYQKFRLATLTTGLLVIGVQALLCIPSLSHLLFGRLLGLPPSITQPAEITLLVSIPLQYLFFLRIPYFVVMYNGKATGKASLATIARIVLTAALSPLFCALGFVGPIWAVICLTIPVAVEVLTSKLFASAFLKSLRPCADRPASAGEIFIFNLPLSIGGYFLAIAAVILGGFIARAPDPERVLPVYYLCLGLANPMAFAATRLQTMVLVFASHSHDHRQTFRFSLSAGGILGILPLIFILPGLEVFYYVRLQNLSVQDLQLVKITALSLILFPVSVAIRSHSEGLAAWLKKPLTILAGHTVFLVTIVVTGILLLWSGFPGYLIGSVGLTLGSLASSAVIRLTRHWGKVSALSLGQKTTSIGQLR